MSCTNFNSNTSPQITFGGSVPGNSCFTDVPTLFTLFKNSLVGTLPSTFSTFIISDTQPAPSDRDKVWVYVDSTTCRPIGIRLYLNGAWVDIGARYFYGVDSSSVVNTITVTSTTPSVNWAEAGQLYAIKVAAANTGPVTVTLTNGSTTFYSAIALTKNGASPLEGLEMLAGSIALILYDGTQFQLLNPRSGSSTSSSSSSTGFNLSFDDDTDANGIPDGWNVYARGGSATGVSYTGSGGTDAQSTPLGGTFALDTTTVVAGSKSAKFTAANGAGNGGGFMQNAGWIPCDANSVLELSWWVRTNATGIDCMAEVLWYSSKSDSAGYISKTTLWTDTLNGPNGLWYQIGGIAKAPSTALFFRVRLTAGILNNDVAGTVWFDDVQLNAPRFSKQITFSDLTVATNKWVAPSTTYQAKVICVGAGGKGGDGEGSGANQCGSGGGGGGTGISYVTVAPSSTHSVVVSATLDSTFDATTVVGNAGTTGVVSVAGVAAGGAGGSANTGNVTVAGEAGQAGGGASDTGHGGNSTAGAGGTCVAGGSQAGQKYGGGGGASRRTGAGAALPGMAGAQGAVIIYYN